MAVTQHIFDLINADIDGEIGTVEKRELETILATDGEARALHSEITALCQTLDAAESVEPPPYLKHIIMGMAAPKRSGSKAPALVRQLFSAPGIRIATAFAAGVILTLGFVGSDRISRNAFDDITGMVGTMSDRGANLPARDSVHVSHDEIAGTVTIYRSVPMLVVDFDLVSRGPVDIVAEIADKGVWFSGFAQLESNDTSVATEPGRVTLRIEGKRRYVVYLHDAAGKDVAVDLHFLAAGQVIHEARLVSGHSI